MAIDREYLVSLAAETCFPQAAVEKVLRLIDILRDIGVHPLLSRVLLLKGGTALNLFYGPPARLSVDLDFNYVGALDRSAMLAERPEVERAVEIIARARRYEVQRSAEEHAGQKYYLNYCNAAGTPDRIEVDINYLHRVSIGAPQRLTPWTPDNTQAPLCSLVATEELFSGKFCALVGRGTARDYYDMSRIPKLDNGSWFSPRTRAISIAMSGVLTRPYYHNARQRLSRITQGAIISELHPMLRENDRPTSDSLTENVWQAVASLMGPTDDEQQFVERLQKGELRLELLFPDDEETLRLLRAHPALLWKMENARKHWQQTK